jgi:hypothetical protein
MNPGIVSIRTPSGWVPAFGEIQILPGINRYMSLHGLQ